MTGLLGTRDVGSAHADRVKIKQGAFGGLRAIVVKVQHPGSVLLRITSPGKYNGRELPFGPSEFEVIQ